MMDISWENKMKPSGKKGCIMVEKFLNDIMEQCRRENMENVMSTFSSLYFHNLTKSYVKY